MINRSPTYKQMPLNIVGSSIFGRYDKMSTEKTYNMFISDNWLVPYSGYKTVIDYTVLGNPAITNHVGRAIYTSTKLNKMIVVVDNYVWLVNLFFDQNTQKTFDRSTVLIGTLTTYEGAVYIAENNKPQIAISDNSNLYIYDPNPPMSVAKFSQPTIDFVPGYITFHDTYFICAALLDNYYTPAATNTWRLSKSNDGNSTDAWKSSASSIGLIQTKPDKIKGVVRVPSKGNMIFVIGETVTESWFDTGAQSFPYQRNNQFNIDYGCVSPSTIAYTDEIVVWLAKNEKSGPIIIYSNGGMPQKITTDGIDYLFSQLTAPEDSEGFIFRQDGHLIYHINFYTDNLSLFYDFNSGKFFHASDENLNYFIANGVSFFNNQYYFVSKNDGNMYAFDTIFTTYDGKEIPRIRICQNVRLPDQTYFIANDIGFTIETGSTDYEYNFAVVDGSPAIEPFTPKVSLSISYDGGVVFGNEWEYILNPIGQRKNRLMWWQLGSTNDLTPQFKFSGFGRFVVTDGIVSIRQ